MEQYILSGQTMTGQAEEIRRLLGIDVGLLPGEMTEQLQQANALVEQALACLADKGVSVSDNAGLPQLPQLIDAVPTGDGGESLPVETCTLIIRHDRELVGGYTVCEDGITLETRELLEDAEMESSIEGYVYYLENVAIGSAITLVDPMCLVEYSALYYDISGSAADYALPFEGVLVFQAPPEPEECIISIHVT